jgi:hypothetical protein
MGRTGYRGGYTLPETLALLGRLLRKGVLAGGPSRLYHFARTIPITRPHLVPTMIADWIAGLSMRKFAADHLWPAVAPDLLEQVREALARYVRQSEVWVTRHAELPSLNIRIGHGFNMAFFHKARPELRKLLTQSQARLTLAIDNLGSDSEYRKELEKLLKRLSRYGDRVAVEISEATRARLGLDLSAFEHVAVG